MVLRETAKQMVRPMLEIKAIDVTTYSELEVLSSAAKKSSYALENCFGRAFSSVSTVESLLTEAPVDELMNKLGSVKLIRKTSGLAPIETMSGYVKLN